MSVTCEPCDCCGKNTIGDGPMVKPWICWACQRDIEDADANEVGKWSPHFSEAVLRYREGRPKEKP